ncbi:MAG: cytochrome c maturation protein CcmE [Proteobacteria bacterium]|nr:cytochrome c maturation protein CcmE [Pseudomonadota bacterium]
MSNIKKSRATSTKWMIGIAVIAGAIVAVAMTQINANTVYFYTPEEVSAKSQELSSKVIKVGGMVIAGSVDWKAEDLDLSFTMTDLKNHEIRVNHKGTPPDMFKEGQGVVVEGTISADGKSMKSRKLLVKHSEEYKKQGDHSQGVSKELLEKSMFKDQIEEQSSGGK